MQHRRPIACYQNVTIRWIHRLHIVLHRQHTWFGWLACVTNVYDKNNTTKIAYSTRYGKASKRWVDTIIRCVDLWHEMRLTLEDQAMAKGSTQDIWDDVCAVSYTWMQSEQSSTLTDLDERSIYTQPSTFIHCTGKLVTYNMFANHTITRAFIPRFISKCSKYSICGMKYN